MSFQRKWCGTYDISNWKPAAAEIYTIHIHTNLTKYMLSHLSKLCFPFERHMYAVEGQKVGGLVLIKGHLRY